MALRAREEEVRAQVRRARMDTQRELAKMAPTANEELKKLLTDDQVSESVKLGAVKHVHENIGVTGKAAQRAGESMSDETRRKLGAALEKIVEVHGGEDLAVDAEVVNGTDSGSE